MTPYQDRARLLEHASDEELFGELTRRYPELYSLELAHDGRTAIVDTEGDTWAAISGIRIIGQELALHCAIAKARDFCRRQGT